MSEQVEEHKTDNKLVVYQMLITAQASLDGIDRHNEFVVKEEISVNTAIHTYNVTEASFVLFMNNGKGDINELLPQVMALAGEITKVIGTLTKNLNKEKAAQMHATFDAARPEFSLGTLLNYLHTAAEIASVIPPAAPWGALAELIIGIVQKAVAAHTDAKKIDLSKLHQIALVG